MVLAADFAFELNPRLAEVGDERRAAVFRGRVRTDPPALVLVRREGRRQASPAAALLSRAVAPLPAFHRRAAAELSHAGGGVERAAPRAQLAGGGSRPGTRRCQLRCRGAHAPGRHAAAQAVPAERDHQPRTESGIAVEALHASGRPPELPLRVESRDRKRRNRDEAADSPRRRARRRIAVPAGDGQRQYLAVRATITRCCSD